MEEEEWLVGGKEKWVFVMIDVRYHQERRKPVLRLVERRSQRHLVPLIAHHVKLGSSIVSDEWRTYRVLSALGYDHHTVNHSRWYVDHQTGAHTPPPDLLLVGPPGPLEMLRGNRTNGNGIFGRLIHDISKKNAIDIILYFQL